MHSNKEKDQQQNRPKNQESAESSKSLKSFTPPPSRIQPIPPQQPNIIQRLQALPEEKRSKALQPNTLQKIQRKKAEEEQKVLQAKSDGQGNKMPGEVQSKMESSFDKDFSDVNIHADSDKAPALNALAYTQGNDIHFAPGQYNPSSQQGQELLGHELAHVVQQREGQVQADGPQMKGVAVNDSPELEKEADEMGAKAAKGETVKVRGASSSNKIQRKALDADKVDAYFKDYETFAQNQLDQWYAKADIEDGDKLTGAMFAKAARKTYDEKKDLSYVVPVEYALAQARLEGGLMGKERTKGNVFNVGAFDSGVSGTEQAIDDKEKGFNSYYKLMADNFLNNKSADQLLENGNFTTKSGGVYATNPFYEIEIKAEIGGMHYDSSEHVLSGSVGKGKTNNPKDVEFIGGMLAQLGYLSKDKIKDSNAVGDAILKFQEKEMAPEDEEWFKNRMKGVTNETDKESMKQKAKNYKDGIVGKNGQTVGLLYYKSYLSGKIPSTNDSAGITSKPATNNPKEEGWTDKLLHAGQGMYNYLFGSNTTQTPTTPSQTNIPAPTLLAGVVNNQQVGSKEDAIKVQTSLKLLGYYQGTADGFLTRKDNSESDSIKAIKKFQADQKLPATGNIDNTTNAALLTAVAAKSASATAPATSNTTSAITGSSNKTTEKTAESVYKQYNGEMLAIGREMLKTAKTDPKFVIAMLDYLSWYEKDNLAFNLSSHLSESDLASVDAQLIKKLYDELDSGYTKDAEEKQMEKLSKFLPKKTGKDKETKEDKNNASEYKNEDFNLSNSVGKGGKNKAKDVIKVQNLLISFKYFSASSAEYTSVKTEFTQNPDKVIEESKLTETIKAIKEYEKFGSTTSESVTTQTGLVPKDGWVQVSMKELNRIYNEYNEDKTNEEINNLLTKEQWRSQFRWGANYKNLQTEKEQAYINAVKSLTGLDDPADLHTASAEKIEQIKAQYENDHWMDSNEIKTQSIKASEKAYYNKPNFVCCWDTAQVMMGFTGATEKGVNYKVQTFVKQAQEGKYTNQLEIGIKYIDAQLKNGKAVFVGIEKGTNTGLNEGTTDHYIVIIGKHQKDGKWYYNYFDPGTSHKDNGTNLETNKLYIGADKKSVENGNLKLSQVRVNKE